MIFETTTMVLLIAMVLVIVRASKGPTVFDRVLAANTFGTLTVLMIAVLGYLQGRPDWLDLALVYALMNFVGVIAVCKFSRFGGFATDRIVKERAP